MRIRFLLSTTLILGGLALIGAYGPEIGVGGHQAVPGNYIVPEAVTPTQAQLGQVPAAENSAGIAAHSETDDPSTQMTAVSTHSPAAVPVVELSAIRPTDPRTRSAITRGLQEELTRLNCYRGPKDGRWSVALSYSARSFVRGANLNREVAGPDYGLLDAARKARGKICAAPVCYSKRGQGCDEKVRATKLIDGKDKATHKKGRKAKSRGISENGQIYIIGEDGSLEAQGGGVDTPFETTTTYAPDVGAQDGAGGYNGEPAMGLGGPPVGYRKPKKVIKRKPVRRARDPVESIFMHPLGRM